MRDAFDYATYWWLIDRFRASHRIVRFRDFSDGDPAEPFVILRHDVDYSPAAALALARQEKERGVSATYFLLPNTRYYNLLAPEHASFARELTTLGHEVGLHYDVNTFAAFPRVEQLALLREQAALLGSLSGQRVVSIAMHQPALNGGDPFGHMADSEFLNAYDDRFTVHSLYVSDSCRAWRDSAWQMFESDAFPPRLHLTLHPINWSQTDRSREQIFGSIHEQAKRDFDRAGADLMEKINQHTGVLEHERRAARQAVAHSR